MGIPPLSGFIGKFFMLVSLTQENFFFLVLIALFFIIFSCFYYLRLIKIISFNNNKN